MAVESSKCHPTLSLSLILPQNVRSFGEPGFILQELQISFNCTAWICQYAIDSHPAIGTIWKHTNAKQFWQSWVQDMPPHLHPSTWNLEYPEHWISVPSTKFTPHWIHMNHEIRLGVNFPSPASLGARTELCHCAVAETPDSEPLRADGQLNSRFL